MEEYGTFRRGLRVFVYDSDGYMLKRTTWHFLYHCTNTETGAEWFELFGGRAHHQSIRAFRITQVSLKRVRRG